MQWISGKKRLPEIDNDSDFPEQYTVRFKGDDPRSGWVEAAIMTAEEMHNEKYDNYWEWYDPEKEETESPAPIPVEFQKRVDKWMGSCFGDEISKDKTER